MIPPVKDHKTHEGLDSLEQRLTPGEHLAEQRRLVIAPFPSRMEQKGEEVETAQNRGEGRRAMPKVVRQLVALGREPVGLCVGALPAPTTRWRHVPHVGSRQALRAAPALVLALCACGGLADREVAPLDRPGIVTPSQQHVVDVMPQRHGRAATMPAASCTLGPTAGGLPQRQARRARGMGGGLARQAAVATVGASHRTQGLVAVESIAQAGDALGRHPRRMGGEPAVARRSVTVLVGMPVWRHDVRGGQGAALRRSGADDPRGDGGVSREGWAIGEVAGERVVARYGVGRNGVGTIQGHQSGGVTVATMRQHAVLFQARKDVQQPRIASARRDRIAPRAALMIPRHLLHPQQGVDVMLACGVLQGALVVQQ